MFRTFRGVATVSAAITTAAAMALVVPPAGASPLSPTISAFSPAAAVVGDMVTIDGSGLSSVTGVTFNFIPAQFAIVSNSEITATVPLGEDRGPITVTAPGGTATSVSSFTLLGFYVTTASLSGAQRGFSYSVQLEAAGGTLPYRWTLKGALPKGLTMTRAGVLSGLLDLKKAVPGTYTFNVSVRDATKHSRQVATRALSLTVS
jgi:hypothetical protein